MEDMMMNLDKDASIRRIVAILLWGLGNMYAHCYLNEVGFYSLQCEWQGYYPEISKEQE
jgi:hypothetical protein